MKITSNQLRLSLLSASLVSAFLVSTALGAGGQPPTRLQTDPGTPPLIPAGPVAEAMAKASTSQYLVPPAATTVGAAPLLEGAPGANPPLHAEGDFVIGPTYVRAPELSAVDGVPLGTWGTITMNSEDSKFYPGITKVPPGGPTNYTPPDLTKVVSYPKSFRRTITVYVPPNYVAGTIAPLIVGTDGTGSLINPNLLNNLIAQHRIPPVVAIMISTDGSDAQGSQRGLEYDTMSGLYAEWVESEVIPLVEKTAGVTITKDPEGRMTTGGSSGASCALIMAWFHPELYHRVLSYSGTFVNQQSPLNPAYPHGAWAFAEGLIKDTPAKPIRIWMEVGDRDLLNPNSLRDGMHDWVKANNAVATAFKAKGYHYQFSYALNAGHVDGAVKNQTMPEALEWVWQGYVPVKR